MEGNEIFGEDVVEGSAAYKGSRLNLERCGPGGVTKPVTQTHRECRAVPRDRERKPVVLAPARFFASEFSGFPASTFPHAPAFLTALSRAVLGGLASIFVLWSSISLHAQSNDPTPYTFSTLTGEPGSAGCGDGTRSVAQFSFARSAAVDVADNVYIADSGNHTIRKVTGAGGVTTLAGEAIRGAQAEGAVSGYPLPTNASAGGTGNQPEGRSAAEDKSKRWRSRADGVVSRFRVICSETRSRSFLATIRSPQAPAQQRAWHPILEMSVNFL